MAFQSLFIERSCILGPWKVHILQISRDTEVLHCWKWLDAGCDEKPWCQQIFIEWEQIYSCYHTVYVSVLHSMVSDTEQGSNHQIPCLSKSDMTITIKGPIQVQPYFGLRCPDMYHLPWLRMKRRMTSCNASSSVCSVLKAWIWNLLSLL